MLRADRGTDETAEPDYRAERAAAISALAEGPRSPLRDDAGALLKGPGVRGLPGLTRPEAGRS